MNIIYTPIVNFLVRKTGNLYITEKTCGQAKGQASAGAR